MFLHVSMLEKEEELLQAIINNTEKWIISKTNFYRKQIFHCDLVPFPDAHLLLITA